mgnify:CR=1 FL=1
MEHYITFPNVSPDLFSVTLFGFTIAPKWYAMAYIMGIIIGWFIAVQAVKRVQLWDKSGPAMQRENIEDLVTWIVLGVVLGGRLGYVLFYKPDVYLADPIAALKLWEGGMAFHGGLAGVLVAVILYCRKYKFDLWKTADMLAIATAPGLLMGRIANFINAELWGRATLSPWGVAFPGYAAQDCPPALYHADGVCARYPSQLFEAGLEGLLLGALVLIMAFGFGALKRKGLVTGVFFIGYGLARTFVEYFRQADEQFITSDNPLGLVIRLGDTGLSMGQLLSLPMVIFGVVVLIMALKRKPD